MIFIFGNLGCPINFKRYYNISKWKKKSELNIPYITSLEVKGGEEEVEDMVRISYGYKSSLSALEESCAAGLWAWMENIKETETAHMCPRMASL